MLTIYCASNEAPLATAPPDATSLLDMMEYAVAAGVEIPAARSIVIVSTLPADRGVEDMRPTVMVAGCEAVAAV